MHSLPSLNEEVLCILLTCHLIPHPSYSDIVLDSHTFVTCHKMDMTYIYCDNWLVAVSSFVNDLPIMLKTFNVEVHGIYLAVFCPTLHSMFLGQY